MSWFNFHFQDFAFAFLSVLFEGVPFVLFGTLLSGLIDAYLPSRLMTRFLPRNSNASIVLAGLMGLVFPMCECGIVPVIRRLVGKGLPVSCALAYMLAAPIVNPVVAISTYAAFRGQNPILVAALRLLLGFAVAVLVGFACRLLKPSAILRPEFVPREGQGSGGVDHAHGPRWRRAIRVAAGDFLDVCVYLVIGAAITCVFNTAVDQQLVLPLAINDWLAVFAMMGLAGILSLCSTSDAFIAATFVAFPTGAKLAFMVFGPMMDLKLLFLYSSVFRKRFVVALALGLSVVIGLLCVKLSSLPL